ncbi:hypothetical protein [Streptomyces sp. NPDC053069]|uniref:hypothetical protein n=1 Tax=Streptomyces sp. NPDC053069 TaxID=3365695 RepID=UPI0037D1AA25
MSVTVTTPESALMSRLLLFAVLRARPLNTLDQITIRRPRAIVTHIAIHVDVFRWITAAGP